MNKEKTGILDELKRCLLALEAIGRTMQKALVARDTKAINEAVTNQEEMFAHATHLVSMLNTEGNAEEIDEDEKKIRGELKGLFSKIKRIANTNYRIASIYLDIIAKTLNEVAQINSNQTNSNVYNQYGRLGHNVAPMLVEDKG